MSEPLEKVQETAHEAHHARGDSLARNVAVMVSMLAAVMAIAEIGAKSNQSEYITRHVSLSNNWAFYQSKNIRAVAREAEADLLEAMPRAEGVDVAAKVKAARDYAARMRDDPKGGEGMKQLIAQAQRLEAERDAAFHAYHGYEYTVGALEIAIVLASVSLVTRMRPLTIGAGAVGVIAALYGLAIAGHLL